MKPTVTFLALSCLLLGSGCERFDLMNFRSQTPEEETLSDQLKTEVDRDLIGEFVNVGNLNVVVLEGVGLVTGLPGTGGDPPVSHWRTQLLDDMQRRGIPNPNEILQSKSTALVVVRAYLPPLVRPGDRFDVEVRVPDNADVQSLNGGQLLETRLTEKAYVAGKGVLDGHVFAKAAGPILVGTSTNSDDADQQRGTLLRGRILGGGYSLKERNMSLLLRNEYRSERMAFRIAQRVGSRFYDYHDGGRRIPLAEAKTNELIELKIHSLYRDNHHRYIQVIRSMALNETEVGERVRMQQLEDELHNPLTCHRASIELEAMGKASIETLKTGLKNPSPEVRFYAAESLAYLGDSAGVPELAKAAREEPAFRVFALAALAIVDEAESFVELRNLLGESSAETRYGAFRALRSLDKNDPFVRGEMTPAGFRLHELDVPGEPMVHLTRRKEAEIVLFGLNQKFTLPVIGRAGRDIMVTSRGGSDTITLSKITLRTTERREVRNNIADVIRAATELGASYPDIAHFLIQAQGQGNFDGRFELDALPRAGRVYLRQPSDVTGSLRSRTRVGRPTQAPNLYNDDDHTLDPERERLRGGNDSAEDLDDEEEEMTDGVGTDAAAGRASSADVTEARAAERSDKSETPEADEAKPTERKRSWLPKFSIFSRRSDN